jgi:hypothetical protein
MKYLCEKVLYDANFYPDRYYAPIAIRLRDLNTHFDNRGEQSQAIASLDSVIFKHLFHLFNLDVQFHEDLLGKDNSERRLSIIQKIVVRFLEELKVLLILDGFDEVPSTHSKKVILSEIRTLAQQLQSSTLVITSRTGEFPYSIENCKEHELCPLHDKQIVQFCEKWLDDKTQTRDLVTAIKSSPFADTAIKPLTLAHLCAIYERIGRIPDKPKTVYRKIINLLLEEWDEQRSVRRMSKYASFESDRKSEFLSNLAYELTTRFHEIVFTKDQLVSVYNNVYYNFDLPKSEAQTVVEELETHTGLFLQSGFETFEFVHKSLQEFLAAEYIVKLPHIPKDVNLVRGIPNELAIAVSISSNPSVYLTELVLSMFYTYHFEPEFYATFIYRLLQEKPDFPGFDEITLVLFSLYSLYLRGGHAFGVTAKPTTFDESLLQQFEGFIRSLTKRYPGNALHLHYRLYKTLHEEDELIILQKKKSMTSERLPEFIYVRSTFGQN